MKQPPASLVTSRPTFAAFAPSDALAECSISAASVAARFSARLGAISSEFNAGALRPE